MNLYSIALFVHVVGALLLFVTLTVEGVALRLLHRAATPEAAKSAAGMLRLNRIVGPVSALGVLIPIRRVNSAHEQVYRNTVGQAQVAKPLLRRIYGLLNQHPHRQAVHEASGRRGLHILAGESSPPEPR